MKKLWAFALAMALFWACQNPDDATYSKSTPVDKAAIEKAAGTLMDQFYASYQADDTDDTEKLVSDKAVLMGTDPAEVWTKAEMLEAHRQYKLDPALAEGIKNMSIEAFNRHMIVSDDGSQVIVTDLTHASFSKLTVRVTSVLEKENDNWKIVYLTSSFVIDNLDLEKVDSVMD